MTIALGINAYHADASAAIMRDGKLLAAVEEERFTRVKHTAGFPSRAIKYCVEAAGVRPEEIDYVAVPRKRSAHIARKLMWALRSPSLALGRGKAWRQYSSMNEALADSLGVSASQIRAQFHSVEHHVAHVASSYYTSPFEDAAVLSLDGLGDFASMCWGTGEGKRLELKDFVLFPHSLGFYYTAVTQYLGFPKYGDEYKVMGLAAYGQPRYKDEFQDMVRAGSDLDFKLNLKFFRHQRGGELISWQEGEPVQAQLFSDNMEKTLGPARRSREEPVTERHQDIAATLQWQLEEVVIELLNQLHRKTGKTRLAYAGGVAFNCATNGKIFQRTPFKDLYIHPAAGDAGLAVGAAAYVIHNMVGLARGGSLEHAYLGPEFSNDRIRSALESSGLRYQKPGPSALFEATAQHIAAGKIVGWYQGRTEWGPRALGNRSIVADPRRGDMKDILNRRIKHREPFRPFAPSILQESTADWFDQSYPSPFMLLTYKVRPEKIGLIPAPTHVDGTGRLQTVARAASPTYWELIKAFEGQTGVPVLLNTSFNESEPVVNTPEEAISCAVRTGMDVIGMGEHVVELQPGRPAP